MSQRGLKFKTVIIIMENKLHIEVPFGIKYISEWIDYQFPRGHVIVDKGVTGCGYTEYCLTNSHDIVLCSPRKLLLENKSEQHLQDDNIIYLKNEIKDYQGVMDFLAKIKFEYYRIKRSGKPVKFLVTYDSAHYLIDALNDIKVLGDFTFVVDEFQSIFLDSYYKSNVEFDFVEYLQGCQNVLYLSATPMMDKYLKKVPEFKDLPFYELDWRGSGVVETVIIQRKFSTSFTKDCSEIIQNYMSGNFPMTITEDKRVIFSKEAVFYFNSISDIIRIIKSNGLQAFQVNIVCADTPENKTKLLKIGHGIGRIPLKGEPNKMFTFCTKTAYIGSDFHSDCASSFVFADPNISSLALDISLDLPQIVGRQRNRNNPFKNNIVIFYRTIRKSEMGNESLFRDKQDQRQQKTLRLLNGFGKLSPEEQADYVDKLKADIQVSQYSEDFISISKKTGLPVYNSFIEIANERAWEVSQKDYQDKINVTKALNEVSTSQEEYLNETDQEVADFLDNYFYTTGIFRDKMRMYCEFMDKHEGNQEISDKLNFKIKDEKFKTFYNFYGTKGCSAARFEEKNLTIGMMNTSKESELYTVIYNTFKVGDRLLASDVKSKLTKLYNDLGIKKKAKASDLSRYFNLVRTRITNPETKKLDNGFRLDPLV